MSERLDKLFSLAYQGNRLVPDYLLERKRLPREPLYSDLPLDEEQAALYVQTHGHLWRSTSPSSDG